MPIDAKHEELRSLRIERSQPPPDGGPPAWARRYIVIGIAIVVVLSVAAGAYRLFAGDGPEVQVTRGTAGNADLPGTVLTASGYNLPHHQNHLNLKVTG